jgi:hypothetical protein
MKETYGVLGSGSAPRKVIEAALSDLGTTTVQFVIPWYGRMASGLEAVYDWVLDNEASFLLVAYETGKQPPKVLLNAASTTTYTDDVNTTILNHLCGLDVPGLSLILWNQEDEEESIRVSSMSIDLKLPTLELTNGLTPITIDAPLEEVQDHELPDIGDTSYSKETLEVMPAALVKRMAKDKGIVVKTKEEGIAALTQEVKEEMPQEIGSILILMKNGDELGFTLTQDLFQKVMSLVVEHQRPW